MSLNVRRHLLAGQVIPAHPLALTPSRELDERHQRALTRYYAAAGAGGIAVGVHTTQFAIHAPQVGLYRPVLELAAETARDALARETATGARPRDFVLVAGLVGDTRQAVHEAQIARTLGYHAGLLSLAALADADDAALVRHARAVAEVLPIIGFYLQPAVGGRTLGHRFWRELAEIPNLVAIKIAPFDRYRTFDVVRAVAEAGRDDVALYTGNDDSIVLDLLTPFPVQAGGAAVAAQGPDGTGPLSAAWLSRAAALTDANGAIFDAHHAFAGCLPGIHEVLRRQGLMRGVWTLEPHERLSPGQREELDRVLRSYPELTDDDWVAERRDAWMG
jgi:dihydrodipicolinate synthase/N-acetylneuraminate lyase